MVLSAVAPIEDTINKETNIVHNKKWILVKNSYWLEADQLAVYVQDMKELN